MADSSSAVANAFAALSQNLFAGDDVDSVLENLLGRACATVGGCDHASISVLGARGSITTPVGTDPLVVELDEYQYEAGEGPCVQAVKETAPAVYSADLARDERWPTFAPRAAERGVGSILSSKIAANGTVGALNMYGNRAQAFSEPDIEAAHLFAIFAAVMMGFAQERLQATQLRAALESRDVIGQAKGILMEREKLTADQAFEKLRRASQQLNRKLRELAEDIAATGEEPPDLG
jgi:GAF domain-containing protein